MATPASSDVIAEVKEIFRSYLKEKGHRQDSGAIYGA